MKRTLFVLMTIAILTVGMPGAAKALFLPDPTTTAYTYGDFYSYSLPVLAYEYDQLHGGGVGPGNPYYVPSSPGHLADSIVIATGAGGGVVENPDGMDYAYATPNSSGQSTFYTSVESDPYPNPLDPDAFTGDQRNTWDSSIQAFVDYLGEGITPQFFFNNNETDKGDNQDLRVYGTIRVWNTSTADEEIFELISTVGDDSGYGVFGANPYLYDYGDTPLTDGAYALSGGDMCFNGSGLPVPCSDPGAIPSPSFAHNLGANQAAYVIVSPELDDILFAWDPLTSDYNMLSIDLRMYDLSNGYEQAFVRGSEYTPIPEPSTWLLMALGLLALPFARRLRK